ncbi:hypothetical protein K449DRAFT_387645 [Hypoxylon sp. EC38]|nr:hypothetical protein K449DRAFT_387645 [Hypoxylon sp. EC38]
MLRHHNNTVTAYYCLTLAITLAKQLKAFSGPLFFMDTLHVTRQYSVDKITYSLPTPSYPACWVFCASNSVHEVAF